MNAKEARQITEGARTDNTCAKVLYERAILLIKSAAAAEESRITNPFLGIRNPYVGMCRSFTSKDVQEAYSMLEQQEYIVVKIGDNVIISW